jgi:hypothetical protein
MKHIEAYIQSVSVLVFPLVSFGMALAIHRRLIPPDIRDHETDAAKKRLNMFSG